MARLTPLVLLVLGLSLCRTIAIKCEWAPSKSDYALGQDIIATLDEDPAGDGDVIELQDFSCSDGCEYLDIGYPEAGAVNYTFSGIKDRLMSFILIHKDSDGNELGRSTKCNIFGYIYFSYDDGQTTFHTHEPIRFNIWRPETHGSGDYISLRSKVLGGEEWASIIVPDGDDEQLFVVPELRKEVDELWLQYYTYADNLVATSVFNITVNHYGVVLTPESPSLDDLQFGQPIKYNFDIQHRSRPVTQFDEYDYIALYSHKQAEESPCILDGTCLNEYLAYEYVPKGNSTGTVTFDGIREEDTVFARYIFFNERDSLAITGNRNIRASGTVSGPSGIVLGQAEPISVDYVASQWDEYFWVAWYSYERAAREECAPAVDGCGEIDWTYVNEETPGSGTVSFPTSHLREPETVFFALLDSKDKVLHRTANISVTVNVTLTVPASVQLDGVISVSYAVSSGHNEYEWIGIYPASERACTMAGTCPGGYIDWQYVPAGGEGTLDFPTTSEFVDGVFFVYHLATDKPVFASSDVAIDMSACTVSVAANIVAERPFIVRYTSVPNPDWYHYVALVNDDGCTSGCDLEWRYLFGSSGVLIFTAPAQDYASKVRVEYRVAGDRPLAVANANVAASATGNVPLWTAASVAEGAEVNSMAGNNATFTLVAMDVKPLEVHCEGVPGDRLFVQSSSKVGTTNSWTFAYTTDSTEHRSVYAPCCYAINDDGLASEPRCFSITVYGTICTSWGDPHLSTFDGVDYDFQGHGDFWMVRPAQRVKANAFGVQARFAPCNRGSGATCNQAIGLKEGTDKISVYFRSLAAPSSGKPLMEVTYNDALVGSYSEDSSAETKKIGDSGATLTVEEGAWEFSVTFKSGLGVKVSYPGSAATSMYINLPGRLFYVPAASGPAVIEGLCGVWDGVKDNDFRYYNVNDTRFVLDPEATTQSIYTKFGLTWRVPEFASFFDYARPGESRAITNPAAFTPAFSAEFDDAELEANAIAFCGSFDMSAREVERCLFDVAVTSDLAVARATVQAMITSCQAGGGGTACDPNAGCPNSCSGLNGKCNAGKCECFKGFIGADCSGTAPDPGPDPKPSSSSSTGSYDPLSAAPTAAAPAITIALLAVAAALAAPLM